MSVVERFTASARKHRIGKARACRRWSRQANHPPFRPTEGLDQRLLFIGDDDRGVTLEVIAIQLPDYLLVIHVVPYALRRRSDG